MKYLLKWLGTIDRLKKRINKLQNERNNLKEEVKILTDELCDKDRVYRYRKAEYSEVHDKYVYHGSCLSCSITADKQPGMCIGCGNRNYNPRISVHQFQGYDEKFNKIEAPAKDKRVTHAGSNVILDKEAK
jgi:hypothetical protein